MSNEVWDDGKSVVKALYQASGNSATRPALPVPSFATGGARSAQSLADAIGNDQSLNPCIRGWINYYSHFYKTQLRPTLKRIDLYVIR
jgi:hypothetical protein